MSAASTLSFLIDVNLSPEWVETLSTFGHASVHWSAVGDVRTPDVDIMAWAREHGHIVFTGDLDFGKLLAVTGAIGPSVFSVRTRKRLPEEISPTVRAAIDQHRTALTVGAFVVLDDSKSRVRILPL